MTLATTCGERLHHLRQTLPVIVEAAHDAGDVLDVEVIVVDYGPTPGVKAFTNLFPDVRRIPVTAAQWNFGKARNAGLHAATGDVFVNVDCDTFIDAQSIETIADWLELQEYRSFIYSPYVRGRHGRFAFFTSELIALGGFAEADLDGVVHEAGFSTYDVQDRAEAAGFNSRKWPGKFRIIDHEVDLNAAVRASQPFYARIRQRQLARKGRGRQDG